MPQTASGPVSARSLIGRPTLLRPALLQGVSLSALLVAGAAEPARAGAFKSLSQALASHPVASVAAAATGGGAVAARQAGLGARNFTSAAARFTSLSQALAAQTYQGPAVPDGVAPGGLQQVDGIAGKTNPPAWNGADTTLTQTVANGITDVTVDQTQSVAALTWKNFNIGAHTRLVFSQGATNWVAINSVQDPAAAPSTILGRISAPGKVFILNPNGILFGAGSQVNVGALVATTASVAQAQFTTTTTGLIKGFSLYGSATGTTTADSFLPTFVNAPAGPAVTVAPGAAISTPVPTGTEGGGYVMLLGGTVQNAGLISTPQGQTVLAAGTNFILQPGYSSGNPTATVIGSQVAVTNPVGTTGSLAPGLGAATNSGLIIADQGDITMVGHAVTQAGVLLATTTIDNRGTVHLLTDTADSTASIVLAPGSVTEVMPEELYSLDINGVASLVTALENPGAATGTLQTAVDAQRALNLTDSVADNKTRGGVSTGPRLNDFNSLTDTLGEGRIEISTGGSVDLQGGALALAQGGQVAVNAAGSILLENGATVDVSGTNATLPASANSLLVQGIVPFYLRDSPPNRTGGLEFQSVYIDARTLVAIGGGAYAGNIYTQGGLLEVSGNLGLIGHGIDEWSSAAGQVTLQAGTTANGASAGGTVAVAAGATINLTGGTVTYQAGLVHQSYVQSADGRIFNINSAPGDLVYTGVYTGVQADHPRWHITQNFVNPLLTPAETAETAYTIGRDAGSLTVSAASALLDGTIAAGVTVGQNQTGARLAAGTDPFLQPQSAAPLGGGLAVGAYDGGALLQQQFTSAILLAAGNGENHGGGNNGTPPVTLPTEAVTGTIAIDAAALNNAGFANVSLLTAGDLAADSALTLADGGTLVLGGGTVELNAGITAHAAQVTLTNLQSSATALSSAPGSITIAAGVRIDTSGEWTNLLADPENRTLIGRANGGSVSLVSTGGIDLAAGSAIDVSSGGQLSTAGKLTAASGGNVAISADIVPGMAATLNRSGNVTLAAAIDGLASGAGGTLTITVPDIVLGTLAGGVPPHLFVFNPGAVLDLPDDALFSSGFSNYVLNGYSGVEVDAGHAVDVTRPVYALSNPALATGAAAAGAYSVVLAPSFTPNRANDTIAQRPGAGLALEATIDPTLYNAGGGPISIDQGASVAVDPGQSITVAGYGQVTDLGTLTAHGGTITVANTRYESPSPGNMDDPNYLAGLSVWIGDGAEVDASGQAAIFTDVLGRRFGQAQAGGTILLGGLGGAVAASRESTYAQVIERPGAVLDAAGAAASVGVIAAITRTGMAPLAGPATLAGNGGTVLARSYTGIALDGALHAAGAGPGAAGGTLTLRMDLLDVSDLMHRPAPVLNLPASFSAGSRILVGEDAVPVQTTQDLAPGEATDPSTILLGRISQAQLDAGGIDTLNLFAQDFIAFDGSTNLHLARAATLQAPILGDTGTNGGASIAAPYVRLLGHDFTTYGVLSAGGTLLTPGYAQATLTVDADLIDLGGAITLGGAQSVQSGDTPGFVVPGFVAADLVSAGDMRFLQSPDGSRSSLDSPGNITLQAVQLYPASGANAVIYAGDNRHIAPTDKTVNEFAGGTLTILGQAGAVPASPYSIGGSLALVSETIIQDGVVRAPEGGILLGVSTAAISGLTTAAVTLTDDVTLGPQSITSVSLEGQTVPYGGTVDGVNYSAAAFSLIAGGIISQPVGVFTPAITVGTAQFSAAAGSQIDLRGGGTLAGAGFIPGRGGTADVNTTPLLNSGSGTVVANTADPVFAIVPGYGAGEAPVAPTDIGYATPGVGEQIGLGAGEVAGLGAGTYTLLPSYYDLLPGAFRVELTGAAVAPGSARPFGNFTGVAAVRVGYANTGVVASVPQAALITSGDGVRQLSQYDEETYNTFEANSAQTFGAARPALPQDAKTLRILLNLPTGIVAVTEPIDVPAASLLNAPAAFTQNGTQGVGYGADVAVGGTPLLAVLGPGDDVVRAVTHDGTVTLLSVEGLADGALDALTQPVAVPLAGAPGGMVDVGTRLVLGGTLSTNQGTVAIAGQSAEVLIQSHADLTAGTVILTASNVGTIQLLPGATVSTQGQGGAFTGAGSALLFTTENPSPAFPVLAVSNSDVQFVPNAQSAHAVIDVGLGATLATAAGGSLNFVGPAGTNVQIAPSNLVAGFVNVQVSNIDVGSADTLAMFASLLPGGLTLTDGSLNTLAQNATMLNLTATQAVNLLGDVALNSGSTNLVLNTPAIYGYGIAATAGSGVAAQSGTISILAPDFTWGGVAARNLLQTGNSTAVSAAPGGRLAGSETVGTGTVSLTQATSLNIDATGIAATQSRAAIPGTITLGYGAGARADDQVRLDRLAVGFTGSAGAAGVTLAATGEITANNQSSLSVYATQPIAGQPGGGDLDLLAPLITADSGAVLKLTAGGTLSANSPGALAATGPVATLGAELDLTAASVDVGTAIALPSGKLSITANGVLTNPVSAPPTNVTTTVTDGDATTVTGVDTTVTTGTITGAGITLDGATIDLAGRRVAIFDQTALSQGGTLALESASGTVAKSASTTLTTLITSDGTTTLASSSLNVATNPASFAATGAAGNDITIGAGTAIDVSSPGANAGAVSISALDGTVSLLGTLAGAGTAGGGSFVLAAGALGTATSFDGVNAVLDTGAFTGRRDFELATGDIDIDRTVTAHTVEIAADAGNITVSGTIDASGAAPGSIALSAGGTLALDGAAVLDAHATQTALDSHGAPIDAENRAHVTLTSTGGAVVFDADGLAGPATTIDVGYPGAGIDPQGQLVINAPRLASPEDVAVTATRAVNVGGAQAIDLFAFKTYAFGTGSATDPNGTIVQDSSASTAPPGALGLVQIGQDDSAYMARVDADGAALAARLAGLASYQASGGGSIFHLAPGVEIDGSATTGGNLTISGDLDFSALRTSDPAQFGRAIAAGVAGSGEPGSIVFRAGNDLIVNGSVSDGFAPPPDASLTGTSLLAADTTGWNIYDNSHGFSPTPWTDPTNSDLLLPSSAYGSYKLDGATKNSSEIVLLGSLADAFAPATVFDTTRPISLNYAITIQSARLKSNVVIPFGFTVGFTSQAVPAGGWIATSGIMRGGVLLYRAGQLIPAGFTFLAGDVLGAGAVLPLSLATGAAQPVPAGTPFNVFADPTVTLAADTAPLPANALIPAASQDYFGVAYPGDGTPNGTLTVAAIATLALRPTSPIAADGTGGVQGALYPLAALLPSGQPSWNMAFVSGANQTAADTNAVRPLAALYGGAADAAGTSIDQAPGSLLIDDQHYFSFTAKQAKAGLLNGDPAVTAFSVIRTGTGDLSLVAGGNIDQSSLYGIYTAGTQDSANTGGAFDPARQTLGPNGNLLPNLGSGKHQTDESALGTLVSGVYQANYPTGGGDVLVAAQGNMTGDVYADATSSGSGADVGDAVGNWLWREGGTQFNQPTAWWINFGTLVDPLQSDGTANNLAAVPIQMTGFQGIGALGGGNVTIAIGGDAGEMTARDAQGGGGTAAPVQGGEGLVIAVGSTGRLQNGTLTTTGGGDIDLTVGGTLNPLDATAYGIGAGDVFNVARPGREAQAADGDLIDIRGNIIASAGAVGRIDYIYNTGVYNLFDPRATQLDVPNDGQPNGGIVVVPGDGTVSISTNRDLVLGGAGDPGRVAEQGLPALAAGDTGLPAGCDAAPAGCGDLVGFTLWRNATSISLFSAGGNVAPTSVPNQANLTDPSKAPVIGNAVPTDFRSEYPPTLLVTAAAGDIIYGQPASNPAAVGDPNDIAVGYVEYSLETMPSQTGQVQFLAGKSIFANGYTIDISGADPAGLPTPANPAFTTVDGSSAREVTNVVSGPQTGLTPLALFALEADTPSADPLAENLHESDPVPARFYAADGDIVNFQTGQTLNFVLRGSLEATWYLAAKPVWILASNDIVSTGTRPSAYPVSDPALFSQQENEVSAPNPSISGGEAATVYSSGNLILNNTANDISVLSAGRDILSAYAYIIGPGLLEVDAGRNLYQAAYTVPNGGVTDQILAFGAFKSLGGDFAAGGQTSLAGGAGIAVLAGIGSAGPDYTAFADLYFTPSNQATLSLSLTDPANKGKVQQVYAAQLLTWLQTNFGYAGDAGGASAAFQALPSIEQAAFVRGIFFEELTASGQQESDPSSRFYHSYVRGQTAIDTLLPNVTAGGSLGVPAGYVGGITAYSGPVTLQNGGTPVGTFTVDGGIATLLGGSVQVLDPGGNIEFGIPGGPAPGNNSGIITYGAGDIDIYALDSVLLGKSRIFATGGGDITIWSSSGDINAGIGAKTTISYNPPVLNYDDVGDVTQSPPSSTSGAGIATLQPLPSVPAGDVSLIAPAGTVDAGEAGVRVSGNLVLAAARVSGTANITVKGSTQGAPTVSVASLGAVEAAGAAAGAATSAATNAGNRNNQAREVASILDVEVLSVGGTYEEEQKRRKRAGLK